MKSMTKILSENPIIGATAGLGSGIIYTVKSFIMDESILQVLSACGIWLGVMVAALTGVLKLIEVFKELFGKWKN